MTRRYPAYRESGVEWLGEVPTHWTNARLKFLTTFGSGGTPARDNMEYWGGDIPWVSPKDMKDKKISSSEEAITPLGLQESASSLFEPGTVLMVVRSGILKHTIPVGIATVPVAINQDIKALRFERARCLPTFFAYLVWGNNDLLLPLWSKQGATVESIEHQYLADTEIPLPPLPEQTAIAAFLDIETAKIDGLVAEQRRLIDLLREKRQAVISPAVTKGLNPAAPLKPSGIDWLGDVPEGWDSSATGRYASVLSGFAFPSTGFSLDENDTPLLRGVNVGVGELRWDDTVYWKREPDDGLDPWVVREGDLIIGMDRPWVSAGVRVAIVQNSDLPCLLLQRVAVIRPNAGLNQRYLMLHLSSDAFVHFFLPDTTGVSVPHISPTQIKNFPIVVPPRHEQDAIVEFVAQATAKLDTLTATAESAIALLQERRAALISAAVTGKIDVRPLMDKGSHAA